MKVENAGPGHVRDPTPAEFAEAAAWVARLHGPNRSTNVERGVRRWLEADSAHAAAFEAITAGWDVVGRIPKQPLSRVSRWQRLGYRQGFIRSAVAVAGFASLIFAALLYFERNEGVVTGIGEQRVLALEDGTRVTLNTDTRIRVKFDESARLIELDNGEALFEVAKRSSWPFIVKAGDRHVTAIGTSFVVRRDPREVVVTLVEGRVAVAPIGSLAELASPSASKAQLPSDATNETVTLRPGQRVRFAEKRVPRVDSPPIDKVTAWRRGLLDFENTPLSDAATEMNRYSAIKLVIEDPRAEKIAITGVFRAGDATSMAAAVARMYHLRSVESGRYIRLTEAPAAAR